MYPWLEYWYEEFNTCSCNKCNGQIIAIMSKDKYNQVDIEKLFCSECGREFFGYSFNKTEEGLVYNFNWDKWKDKEGDE